jgi:hypothetical protein
MAVSLIAAVERLLSRARRMVLAAAAMRDWGRGANRSLVKRRVLPEVLDDRSDVSVVRATPALRLVVGR